MPTRTDQATVKRYAIYVKRQSNGVKKYLQRPYDVVSYNWNDGNPETTYVQFHGYRNASRTLDEVVYDDVRFYDNPPDWDPYRTSV